MSLTLETIFNNQYIGQVSGVSTSPLGSVLGKFIIYRLRDKNEVYNDMRIIKCIVENKIECSNSTIIHIAGNTIEFNISDETLVVFETHSSTRIICSGIQYQFHQWGSTSYQLWLFEKGSNVCLLLGNVNLVELTNGVILVKETGEDIDIDYAIINYVQNTVSKLGLIILLSKKVMDNICFKNITSYSTLNSIRKCLEKVVES